MPTAFLIAARRTPIARVGKGLRQLAAEQLAAVVLQAVLADAGMEAIEVDEVILGNAVGGGGNVARLAALTAGFPVTVPGVTIDRQCGSGLEAINLAAQKIIAGAAEVILAGGVESVSTAPWRIDKPSSLYELPQFSHRARFSPETIGDPEMGIAAEAVAQKFGISRDRQDHYAWRSHQKAIAAQQTDRFQELLPIVQSGVTLLAADEGPRPTLSLDRLGKLPPAFLPNGTVTAGNACPINDGAAAVLLISERKYRSLKLRQGLKFIDATAVGVDPNLLGIAPVSAVQRLLSRQNLSIESIRLIEFNEAFAAQVLACLDCLNLSEAQVNLGGGAIALGHPYGASGAILVTRLFTELKQTGELGIATLGIAGGLGIATLFEQV